MDVVETVGTGTFETIVLEGNGMSQTEEHVDASMIDLELQQLAARMDAGRDIDFPDDETGDDIPQDVLLELTEPLDDTALQADGMASRSPQAPQDDLLGDPQPHAQRALGLEGRRRGAGAGTSGAAGAPQPPRPDVEDLGRAAHRTCLRRAGPPAGAGLEPRRTTHCASSAVRRPPLPGTRSSCAPAC